MNRWAYSYEHGVEYRSFEVQRIATLAAEDLILGYSALIRLMEL